MSVCVVRVKKGRTVDTPICIFKKICENFTYTLMVRLMTYLLCENAPSEITMPPPYVAAELSVIVTLLVKLIQHPVEQNVPPPLLDAVFCPM